MPEHDESDAPEESEEQQLADEDFKQRAKDTRVTKPDRWDVRDKKVDPGDVESK